MARVTSKLQVTIPKVIAERYQIRPGVEVDWLPAGQAIRVVPHAGVQRAQDRGRRLELFDRATQRQAARDRGSSERDEAAMERGWQREELYTRGGAD
jgi:bifunctional DNA-binding transcriptional regulator/antitoxin component of YhaV-PrlF toxin-antitoxin module